MKRKVLSGFAALCLGLVVVSCGPNDAKIQKDVATKLQTTTLPVTATVQKGAVSLEGIVETDAQKADAEAAVKAIKGVKSVINNITVTPPPPPAPVITPDQAFNTVISTALTASGLTGVTAVVADSVITLTGEVAKAELKKVMQVVNDLKPKKVVNELKVK